MQKTGTNANEWSTLKANARQAWKDTAEAQAATDPERANGVGDVAQWVEELISAAQALLDYAHPGSTLDSSLDRAREFHGYAADLCHSVDSQAYHIRLAYGHLLRARGYVFAACFPLLK